MYYSNIWEFHVLCWTSSIVIRGPGKLRPPDPLQSCKAAPPRPSGNPGGLPPRTPCIPGVLLAPDLLQSRKGRSPLHTFPGRLVFGPFPIIFRTSSARACRMEKPWEHLGTPFPSPKVQLMDKILHHLVLVQVQASARITSTVDEQKLAPPYLSHIWGTSIHIPPPKIGPSRAACFLVYTLFGAYLFPV
jgi:hypothetical protein